ncbi:peptidoglycan LD-endopeptidase [Serratia phage vB_SmaM-Susuwatari]|nr:peptidoglycan LD-endopeptidase [Serratia phage vB_SmaM-Susuwatari]
MLKHAEKMQGVHPQLQAVVRRAAEICTCDISVVEGLRTIEKQRQMVAEKKSQTMKSRHLLGQAVDLFNGKDWEHASFYPIADAMKQAAKELGVQITWGGDWKGSWDKPHFQIEGV